jgi:short-subunit dehydrogenase
VLTKNGVDLADVYTAQGKVLMGVARWEREQKELAEATRFGVATRLKRSQLKLAQAEAVARLRVVQTEIEAREAEIATLVDAAGAASTILDADRSVLLKMRHADKTRRVVPPPEHRPKRDSHGAH